MDQESRWYSMFKMLNQNFMKIRITLFKRSTNLWRHRNKYHSVTTSKTLPIDHVLDISVVDSDIFNMNGLNVDNYEVIVDNQPYLS